MVCTNCQAEQPDEVRFCGKCGRATAAPWVAGWRWVRRSRVRMAGIAVAGVVVVAGAALSVVASQQTTAAVLAATNSAIRADNPQAVPWSSGASAAQTQALVSLLHHDRMTAPVALRAGWLRLVHTRWLDLFSVVRITGVPAPLRLVLHHFPGQATLTLLGRTVHVTRPSVAWGSVWPGLYSLDIRASGPLGSASNHPAITFVPSAGPVAVTLPFRPLVITSASALRGSLQINGHSAGTIHLTSSFAGAPLFTTLNGAAVMVPEAPATQYVVVVKASAPWGSVVETGTATPANHWTASLVCTTKLDPWLSAVALVIDHLDIGEATLNAGLYNGAATATYLSQNSLGAFSNPVPFKGLVLSATSVRWNGSTMVGVTDTEQWPTLGITGSFTERYHMVYRSGHWLVSTDTITYGIPVTPGANTISEPGS